MKDIILMILSGLGALFILLAAIGLLRMPDYYLRVSVTTKAATLGIGLVLVAASIYFNDFSITSRAIAIVVFMFLTAPVGAHMISRASYINDIPLWDKSLVDDLKDQYDPNTHELKSGFEKSKPEEDGAGKGHFRTEDSED
jgi:multicomponent Na+:H+ antiporter subunit G